jgi:hypothetical protein
MIEGTPDMAIAVFPILILAGLLAVGMIVVLVLLLAHPKTRVAGAVLTVILLVLLGVGGVAAVGLVGFRSASYHHAVQVERRRAAEEHARRQQVRELERIGAEMERATIPLEGEAPGRVETAPDFPSTGPSAADAPGQRTAPSVEAVDASGDADQRAGDVAEDASNDAGSAGASGTSEPDDGAASSEADSAGGGASDSTAEAAGGAEIEPNTEPNDEAAAEAAEPGADAGSKPVGAEPAAAANRPAWIDQAPRRTNEGYEMAMVVGPYTTRLECESHLPGAVAAALDEYTEAYLGRQWVGRIDVPELRRKELVVDQWQETIQASFGPMIQLHVLLRFDDRFNGLLREARRQAIVH